MPSERNLPWKKQPPTNNPELLEIWRIKYRELRVEQGMGKSEALETIGKQYRVSRQTIAFHLIPSYKNYKKKYGSTQWQKQKKSPEIQQRIIKRKVAYNKARRHIDKLILESYKQAAPKDDMTLEELSESIYVLSGISFHPNTISKLVNHFEEANGSKLLDEVNDYDAPHYILSRT